MRKSVTLAAALVGQALSDATRSTGNPEHVSYKAVIAGIEGALTGSIEAAAGDNGEGVKFTVEFKNLPEGAGPFSYHIHKEPAENNNCTSTLSHLDPFEAGAEKTCDDSAPETCEVGDLSGKHGKVEEDPFNAEYTDDFASIKGGDVSFFGNRSFVIHNADGDRIGCANFMKEVGRPSPSDHTNGTVLPTSTPGPSTTEGAPEPTSTGDDPEDPVPTGAAGMLSPWSISALLVGAAGLALGL